jgi:hypothetical protein
MRGLTYPPVDSALIKTYVSHLTSFGLIPHPDRLRQNGKFVSAFDIPQFALPNDVAVDKRRNAFKKYLKA